MRELFEEYGVVIITIIAVMLLFTAISNLNRNAEDASKQYISTMTGSEISDSETED